MSLTIDHPIVVPADNDDRLVFGQAVACEPVALLSAVSPQYQGLAVYVVRLVTAPPETDDFLEGDRTVAPEVYRVYAGDYGILKEVPVIAVNDRANPKTPDLHIKTSLGEVYLPESSRHAPYYNYIKMYDASDSLEVRENGNVISVVRR